MSSYQYRDPHVQEKTIPLLWFKIYVIHVNAWKKYEKQTNSNALELCHFCIKPLIHYRDPHVKDKTVSRPSYLEHGNPHTWERHSLYWDGAQDTFRQPLSTWLVCFPSHDKWGCLPYKTSWFMDQSQDTDWWRRSYYKAVSFFRHNNEERNLS